MLKISMVEDDELIRETFTDLINDEDDLIVINSYKDCEKAIKDLPKNVPDILLMDIELPGMNGIEGIKKIRKFLPDIDIIVITVHDNSELVFEALCAGACGYLTKNMEYDKLIEAIKDVHRGGSPMSSNIARMVVNSFQKNLDTPLTQRETEVLDHLAKGLSYKMIADALFVDKETVRTHIKHIYKKLEVHSKADAIKKARRERLI